MQALPKFNERTRNPFDHATALDPAFDAFDSGPGKFSISPGVFLTVNAVGECARLSRKDDQ